MAAEGVSRWRSIVDRVRAQAERAPEAVAVESDAGTLTYCALIDTVDQRVTLLGSQLAGGERLVAVCLERTPDLPVWLLAILRARAGYLPLDATLPPTRLTQLLHDAAPALIVVDRANRSALPPTDIPVLVADDPPAGAAGGGCLPAEASPDDLAYVMYTSGSTGRPKGVEIGHGAVTALLDAVAAMPLLGPGQAMLATTRIAFDLSVLELFWPLTVGGRVVLADAADAADPRRLARLIERHRPDVIQATPTAFRALLEAGWPAFAPPHVISGGEPLTPDLARRLLPRCGALWNAYGPTETTVWSTIGRVTEATAPIAIGRAIAGADVLVTDARLRPVAPDTDGEIVIAGPVVGRGYRGDPVLTAARFVTLPDGRRAYRTGDRGRMGEDGVIQSRGRLDDQVKVRGFRIEPGDVENALAAHPALAWCAVRAWTDPAGATVLVGYVVPCPGEAPAPAALAAFCRRTLPSYMVPTRFVVLDRLPQTPSGKIDRQALPAPFAPAAAVATPLATAAALAAIWQEVLAVPAVAPDDDFFALGGYSLLTVRLQRRIEERFGRVLELATLIRASTLAAMAALIEDGLPPDVEVPLLGEGDAPPLFWVDVGPLIRGMVPLIGDRPLGVLNLTLAEEARFGAGPLDIGAVAAALRRRLARAQPHGPIHLGGWCRWGVVAHEVACQLRERGRTVALLILLDAHAPRPPRFAALARVGHLLGPRPVVAEPPSFSQRVERAARHHPARPFAGDALLVRPERGPADDERWRRLVASLDVATVPGDHLSMLRPPHVDTLGGTIAQALRKAARASDRAARAAFQLPVRPRYRMPASVPLLATTSDPSRAPPADRRTRLSE